MNKLESKKTLCDFFEIDESLPISEITEIVGAKLKKLRGLLNELREVARQEKGG